MSIRSKALAALRITIVSVVKYTPRAARSVGRGTRHAALSTLALAKDTRDTAKDAWKEGRSS